MTNDVNPSLILQLYCDLERKQIRPYLTRKNMERFKGPNDLIVADNGDICESLFGCAKAEIRLHRSRADRHD